jgi:guanosine-3',5'-bis(diphosphate) 3'-pyrophosphohydrolase
MERETVCQVVSALRFAALKHRQQRRKGVEDTPYINHPIEILNLLCNEAGVTDAVVLVSALLHDTVEDTDTTLPEIAATFGADVTAVVEQVTDDNSLPKVTRKQLQIEHAPHLCDRAKLIKIADKISNLRDIALSPPAGWSIERQLAYCDWAKAVVDQIRGTNPTLEALFDQAYADAYAACQPQGAI